MSEHKNRARQKALERLKSQREQAKKEDLIGQLLNGDIGALSRAITIVESSLPEHQEKAKEIIDACLTQSGKAKRIGITGVPGVGKSSFLEAFGMYLLKEYQLKIAILAVDPSSKSSGGSILGDKTRMEQLSMEEQVFIRPSPSASSLGGVAKKTREAMLLCEAAGFDIIFVETVGVGQSETTVKNMVDFFLLLMLSGAGDELQGIKRGIMEMADALVVTKADGENKSQAQKAASVYKSAMHLLSPSHSGWTAKVGTCSAMEKTGLDKIWHFITDFYSEGKSTFIPKLRKDQNESWFRQAVEALFIEEIERNPSLSKEFSDLLNQVINHKALPHRAAEEFIKFFSKDLKS